MFTLWTGWLMSIATHSPVAARRFIFWLWGFSPSIQRVSDRPAGARLSARAAAIQTVYLDFIGVFWGSCSCGADGLSAG